MTKSKSLSLALSAAALAAVLAASVEQAHARTPFVVTGARSNSWANVSRFYSHYQPNVAVATKNYGFYAPWAVARPYGMNMRGTPWQRAACAAGACVPSDIRLKRDIALIGRLDNGLGLYRYRYTWSDQLYVGVMAQEVAAVRPDAVAQGPDGYLRVDYAALGLQLQTWEQWAASNGEPSRAKETASPVPGAAQTDASLGDGTPSLTMAATGRSPAEQA